ncbi:MAG TPA: oligosaccharide flippase family protein [Acidimicrobiales bacterium]|nr:oligosaccharide flippase family protein [Acidimicrobiales bacterium]
MTVARYARASGSGRELTGTNSQDEAAPSPGRPSTAQVAGAGAWALSGRVVMLLANLVTIPFTVRLLGPSRYGLWALLQTTLTWAALADVGMSSASTKFSSERYALGDPEGESAVVWGAAGITGLSTGIVALAMAVEAPYLLGHLLKVPSTLLGPGVTGLRLACALLLVQSLSGTVNTPQLVRLRWRSYTLITNSGNLVASVGIPVALALVAGGVVTAATVNLAGACLALAANLYMARRLMPQWRRPRTGDGVARQLLSYGGNLTVSALASIGIATGQRFFLAHNHSTTTVAYYAVAATLGTTLYFLPAQLCAPLMPGLSRLEATGDRPRQSALYGKSLQFVYLVLTPCAIALAFVAQPFLRVWAGPVYAVHSTLPVLMIIVGAWFNALGEVPMTYLLASGRTKVIARVQLAEIGPYLVGAWFLTSRFGAAGAAGVWAGLLVVQSLIWRLATRRAAPYLPSSPLPARGRRAVLVAGAMGAFALVGTLSPNVLIVRAPLAVMGAAVYFATVWDYVLTSSERQGLRRLATEISGRARPIST